MDRPERILIVRPSALGDVCRSVPVLASLRSAYPDARIDWLVNDAFVEAIRHHPDLSEPVPFPRSRLGLDLRRGRLRHSIAYARALRARKYDVAFDCQGLARSGLLAAATGARLRIGYADARELAWIASNERHRIDPNLHAVDRMLALVEAAGVPPVRDMRLYPGEHALAWLRSRPWADERYVVIAPTSRWPAKRWPAPRFAALARHLLDQGAGRILVVGAPGEREQCRPLIELALRRPEVDDLIGGIDVGQLLALISRAALVVANDSAPVHLAVGLDRPLVALYGPTRVSLVGPYRREKDVIHHVEPDECPTHKNESYGRAMMDRISVQEVLAASLSRLHDP